MHNTVKPLCQPPAVVDQALSDDAAPLCVDVEVEDVCDPEVDEPEVEVGEESLPIRAESLASSTNFPWTDDPLTQLETCEFDPSTNLTAAHYTRILAQDGSSTLSHASLAKWTTALTWYKSPSPAEETTLSTPFLPV